MQTIRKLALLLLLLLPLGIPSRVHADDSFTATNPASGQTESVWAAVPLGGSSEIFFSTLQGTSWTPSEQLTSNTLPDKNPHLAFTTQGDRKAVWWRDDGIDVVLISTKPASGGSWSTPAQVSDGLEDARSPQVTVFSGTTFIAYEGVPTSGSRKVIVSKQDNPEPWPTGLVATASQSSPLSIRTHNDSGHLWLDWVDSATYLGWSEYVSGAWTAARYEAYAGSTDIDPGRGRIRSQILGQ